MRKAVRIKRSKIGRNNPCPCGSGKKFKKCHGEMPLASESQNTILSADLAGNSTPTKRRINYKLIGESEFNRLSEYEQTRFKELSEIYSDEIKVIEDYERLICRMVLILGDIPPKDSLDSTIRDLMCDAFDVLYVAKSTILRNYLSLGFPLLRRAYETVCLIHYFQLAPHQSEKWTKGHQFNNSDIRKFLDTHPMGEKEDLLREIYKLYTKGTHVNRDFIPGRGLGEGNQFTLGSISPPNPFVITDYMEQIVRLWYWFVASIGYHYREVFASADDKLGSEYLDIAKRAKTAVQSLYEYKFKVREEQQHGENLST